MNNSPDRNPHPTTTTHPPITTTTTFTRGMGMQGTPAHGSATQTMHEVPVDESQPSSSQSPPTEVVGTLRLVAGSGPGTAENRRLRWDDNVVDNEGMGKKSSKGARGDSGTDFSNYSINSAVLVCCIFTKRTTFGESDSELSSDEDDQDKNAYERQPRCLSLNFPEFTSLLYYVDRKHANDHHSHDGHEHHQHD